MCCPHQCTCSWCMTAQTRQPPMVGLGVNPQAIQAQDGWLHRSQKPSPFPLIPAYFLVIVLFQDTTSLYNSTRRIITRCRASRAGRPQSGTPWGVSTYVDLGIVRLPQHKHRLLAFLV